MNTEELLKRIDECQTALAVERAKVRRPRGVLIKTSDWLNRLTVQAKKESCLYKSQFPALADSCLADSKNYGAVEKDIRAALAETEEEK